ncbi:MAG: heavy metal-responsive transcriptional regulator, partial [Candidatus Paceibacterota bacterium]
MKPLTIGQVARQAGIGVETVRFYEREGLIEEPDRRASGYRQFEEVVVDRLRFIREAKELGFTLKEIKELLSLKLDPRSSCADVRQRAEAKIDDIEEKIRMLQRMKRALGKLTKACSGNG